LFAGDLYRSIGLAAGRRDSRRADRNHRFWHLARIGHNSTTGGSKIIAHPEDA
jgi:hypothetical protein